MVDKNGVQNCTYICIFDTYSCVHEDAGYVAQTPRG